MNNSRLYGESVNRCIYLSETSFMRIQFNTTRV